MSTKIEALPNDAHPTATPAQAGAGTLGLDRDAVSAVLGSLGDGAPLPTRDIPTAASGMSTDAHIQPNHVEVEKDYISALQSSAGPAQNVKMVQKPEPHDIYLLPATAALTVLVLTLPYTIGVLKKWTPRSFWNTDGTGTLMFSVARAFAVGGAVYLVNENF